MFLFKSNIYALVIDMTQCIWILDIKTRVALKVLMIMDMKLSSPITVTILLPSSCYGKTMYSCIYKT